MLERHRPADFVKAVRMPPATHITFKPMDSMASCLAVRPRPVVGRRARDPQGGVTP